ncbi:MAG: PIN domain-containing protein [Solirubrobacteraceae bacterium]
MARHLPRLAAKRGLDEAQLLAALQVMPIKWKPTTDYEGQQAEAEKRIAERDPDDWPTVALALIPYPPMLCGQRLIQAWWTRRPDEPQDHLWLPQEPFAGACPPPCSGSAGLQSRREQPQRARQ